MTLRFAYNTNGLQSHRLEDALDLLAGLGYDGVALTLDHMHLDPLTATAGDVARVARAIRSRKLAVAVETGARFVLDPRRKHRPSLVEKDPLGRARRVDLLRRSVEIARDLGAPTVTLASGPAEPGLDPATGWVFLEDGLRAVLETAARCEVSVAFEPEPGHFVDTVAKYERVRDAVVAVGPIGLALDVSHLSVAEPEPSFAEVVRERAGELLAVHVEDCRPGVHEHLPFGEGTLDLAATLGALEGVGYAGLVAVELSRHSHQGHEQAAAALAALRRASGVG